MNKKLLQMGNNPVKDYTHTITTSSEYIPVDTYSYRAETIEPDSVENYKIVNLSCDESSSTFLITLDQSANNVSYICLGDFSTKSLIRLPFQRTGSTGRVYWSSYTDWNNAEDIQRLFRSAVSKPQHITIVTTPPSWWNDDHGHSGGGAQTG